MNTKWAMAARLAWVFAPSAARLAVAVVPMFSPITRAMPRYIGSTPLEQSIIVMAIRAADDWRMHVSTVPINRNTIIVA